jgi:hypothetical protein
MLSVPVYWHFFSLDAPSIAVLWACSFARTAQLPASASAIAVLGIGTWLIYVADRLLDAHSARHSPLNHDLRERHFFHAGHRRPFLVAAAIATIVLLWLISIMTPDARFEDTLLFAVSMLYFAIVHLPFIRIRKSFPRELAVGILFACATAVPAWSQPQSPHAALLPSILLFAGLCCLNCLAIEIWERPIAPIRQLTIPAIVLCVVAASAVVMLTLRNSGEIRLTAAALVSALLILALDRIHGRFAQREPNLEEATSFLLAMRIAADAALLTPLLFVLPWHG